jgi:hypothetical protein
MTLTIRHAKVTSGTVNDAVEVDLADWNDAHTVTGTVEAAQMPALTGDVTSSDGSVETTLATVNADVGTFGSATQVAQVTLNGKGLATAASNVTVTPAISSVTGLGAGVETFLATPSSANLRAALTDEVGTGAAYFVGGDLGTPASATLTNATGLPLSGHTAQAAYTLVGNNTSGSASPTAVDIAGLTTKATPASGDYIMLSDQAASGAWKKATVSSIVSGGGSITPATMADLLAGSASTFPDSQLLFQLLFADSLIQNNATDPTNDIDVLLDGSAVATKRLDAAWAAGTNQGGLDTGSKANSTTYHVWLLRKDADGTLDALFSTQAISPTVPSGYTKVRILGAIITDGSGVIRPFLQSGDHFALITSLADVSAAASNSIALRSLTVPQGVKVIARLFAVMANAGGGGGYLFAWDADLGSSASGQFVMERLTGNTENGVQVGVMTSSNRQIYTYDDSSGSPTVTLRTLGWIDPRVRRHAV